MAKDKSGKTDITRVDLRIPNHIFEEIEDLAIATNQPLHHISGKVITTPVILNLINLGLESVRKEDFGIDSLGTKESLREAEIEKRVVNSLLDKLDYLVSDKLADIVRKEVNEALTNFQITPPEIEVKEDIKETITPENEDNSENEYVKNLNAIEVKSEVVNEDVSALEDTEAIITPEDNESNFENEDNSKPNETPEVINEDKTYEDAVNEIKKLYSQRFNYSKIAKKLTEEGNYPTKRGKYNWARKQVERVLEESS